MNKMEKSNEEFDDALSFCDLPLCNQEIEPINTSDFPSTHDFFEFSTSSTQSELNSTYTDCIIFCGKIISIKTQLSSDKRSQKPVISSDSSPNYTSPQRPKSFRCCSTNNSGRKHEVMIGLTRIPSKLELSDLRERQNRRTPSLMFPEGVGCGDALAVTGGNVSGKKSQYWGLLRPFSLR